jgi:hypothetical protein
MANFQLNYICIVVKHFSGEWSLTDHKYQRKMSNEKSLVLLICFVFGIPCHRKHVCTLNQHP